MNITHMSSSAAAAGTDDEVRVSGRLTAPFENTVSPHGKILRSRKHTPEASRAWTMREARNLIYPRSAPRMYFMSWQWTESPAKARNAHTASGLSPAAAFWTPVVISSAGRMQDIAFSGSFRRYMQDEND